MATKNKQSSQLILSLVAGLLCQSLVIPVISTARLEEDQKTYYYPPDPHAGTSPPIGSHHTPSHGSGGSYGSTPPSHGTPSHGGGGGSGSHGSSPPSNCGTPPTTPSIDPGTPTIPSISVPSPPFSFDPNSPPFPCNYWKTHPALIWSLFGFSGATLGGAFGLTSSSNPGIGSDLSLEHALSNIRTDGYGELCREGTASLLNSMVSKSFPFTTKQVRDNFISSLGSNKDAAAQAHVFKLANEAQLKPRT